MKYSDLYMNIVLYSFQVTEEIIRKRSEHNDRSHKIHNNQLTDCQVSLQNINIVSIKN